MTASLSRDAADQILAGLGAAHDRIAAAMFAIDGQPALAFLRGGTLSGATAARWNTLRPEVDRLWAHFTVLSDALARARGIRGGQRPDDPQWTELSRLLQEPAIGLDAADLPAEGSGAPPVRWVRLWDLAQQLEQRCGGMGSFLSEVDTAWSVVAGRVAPLTEAVDAAGALAAELGAPALAEAVRRRLAEVHDRELTDPLAAAPGGRLAEAAEARLRELGVEVERLRERLTGMARLRDGYPQRIAALRALADDVAAAEQAVADAFARTAEKIAEPGLPPLPASAAVLRARVSDLERLGRDASWAELADALAVAEQSAHRARERAGELRGLADGLIARRDELRGRLDAYRAKAAATGLAEDGELAQRYEQAHELLFTAPCQLREATRAVRAYQEALASLLEEKP